MSQIDDVQHLVENEFNHLSSTNYVRILDTPCIWGQAFGPAIMTAARQRQTEFARALVEIVQKARYRCDIASLNSPDQDWGKVILGALDTALSAPLGRTGPTQIRFLFGQTPLYPATEPPNFTDFKAALLRLVRARAPFWEQLPDIWVGRFYQFEKGILSALETRLLADSVISSGDTKMTWNHAKIIAVDGVEALVGGHNLNMDLFRSYPPVHDVSVVVHGEAAYGAQLFLNRMWVSNHELLTKDTLDCRKLVWLNAIRDPAKPADPFDKQDVYDDMVRTTAKLIELHQSQLPAERSDDERPDSSQEPDDSLTDAEQTLLDLKKTVFPERVIYSEYDKLNEYKKSDRILSVGKYWTLSSTGSQYHDASGLMKKQLILTAKRSIRMSQMDLISAWKKKWSDHVVCHWIMEALLANKALKVEVVVSPLDGGAGAEGDQYSFGSGAMRTFELIQYYMTHDANTDALWDDSNGSRAEALSRLFIAPLYYTDQIPPGRTIEGQTYMWPDLSIEGYTATLKQPPLSESPPSKGIIGSAMASVVKASGAWYDKVSSAPGNHPKIMIIDDEVYVVGSDNLYPGTLSEFNYLIEGPEAVNAMLESYWTPLWRYSGPHAQSRNP